MPTVTTLPLVLIFLVLWRITGGQILSIVAFVSVFSAASALDFGAMGVAPWLFVLAAGLVLKVCTGHRVYRITPGINRPALLFLAAFLLYACWTGIAYPILFAGTPVVRTVAEEPLVWGMSNFSQMCYLLAAAVLYIMALGYSRQELRQVLDWYVRGCVLAALFAMYQLLNAMTHIPYPSAILYSNKAHVVYNAYMINGMWRLNGTFCEASEMAGFLIVGLVLTGWKLVTQPFRISRLCSLALLLVSLLMTVSSVGYLCLGYVAVCGGILVIRYILQQGSASIVKVSLFLLLVLGMVSVFTVVPSAGTMVSKVVRSTLLEKQNSDSYRNRTMTHGAALQTLSNTYYMGAGWGSARASGLLYVLLATIGIPGLLLFLGFLLSLTGPLFRTQPSSSLGDTEDNQYAKALFSLSVLLIAMLVAGAEPVDPMLWLLFGIATVGNSPSRTISARSTVAPPAYLPGRAAA